MASGQQDQLHATFGAAYQKMSSIGQFVQTWPDSAARVWIFSSIVWLGVVDLFGMTIATELTEPNIFGGTSWLEFGRVRPLHVNGVIFAWLTMMFWGGVFYMLPRLLGTKWMWSERLAIWCAWLWNLAFVAGIYTIMNGYTTGSEYREFVWPVSMLQFIIWVLNTFNVLMTVQMRTIRPLYVTVWWCIASPLWLAADFFIGHVLWRPCPTATGFSSCVAEAINTPSGALASSLPDAMLEWWFSHNLFGLWLTPMLIAITYYMVPRITNTPLYSHTLSLVSFWGMAFFYTGLGMHHILQAPIPGWVKTISEFSSVMLLIPVFAFGVNIWLTMRGNWEKFFTNLPLRFCMTGFIFYMLVNIQGSFEAVQPFNRMTHFTNFVIAHAHLALLGAFTFLGMGFIDYAIPQIYRKPIYSWSLTDWQYWCITIGFVGFFLVLTIAGFIQGQMWAQGESEIQTLPLLHPYFIARSVFGALIVISGFIQAYNIWMTVRVDTRARMRDNVRRYLQHPLATTAESPAGE
jgi:cbb3-type cytochrome c oxidase subunit I